MTIDTLQLETAIRSYYETYFFRLLQLFEHRSDLIDQSNPQAIDLRNEQPNRVVVCSDIAFVFLAASPKSPTLNFPAIEIFDGSGEQFQKDTGQPLTVTITSTSSVHSLRGRAGMMEFISNGHLAQAWGQVEASHYANEAFLSLIAPAAPSAQKPFDAVSQAIEELDRLIQLKVDEAQLQSHLTSNLAILKLVFNGSEVSVKQRVGPSFVTDFSVKTGDLKLLIEIESAVHEILTNKGDLRKEVIRSGAGLAQLG